jgi:hypothetical protein
MTPLRLAHHPDVLRWGWTGEHLLARLIALDHKNVHDMDDTDEGTVAQWSPVFMQNPHTWSLLVDPERLPSIEAVVGYWSFCTLLPEAYDLAIRGGLNDSDITPAVVQPIGGPGEYDAYIVMFVIEEAHRKPGAVMMVRSFFDNLLTLSREGVFVRRLCANAFTPAGERLCRNVLRLDAQSPHSKRGQMFGRTILPAAGAPFPPSFVELNEAYFAHCLRAGAGALLEESLCR